MVREQTVDMGGKIGRERYGRGRGCESSATERQPCRKVRGERKADEEQKGPRPTGWVMEMGMCDGDELFGMVDCCRQKGEIHCKHSLLLSAARCILSVCVSELLCVECNEQGGTPSKPRLSRPSRLVFASLSLSFVPFSAPFLLWPLSFLLVESSFDFRLFRISPR